MNAFNDVKKIKAFSRDPDIMDVYAAVNHGDDNSDMPVLTGDESSQDLLDYMVLVVCRRLQTTKAFKGGYLLNQLLGEQSRMTSDIDFSISDEEGYEQVKVILEDIAQAFTEKGLISEYKIKPTITPTSSGGIDFYNETGAKILGVDVGLHSLEWGVTSYNFDLTDMEGFTVERMLSDKLIAILSRKRFRRTKDLYDFWVITNNFDFDYNKLREFIAKRGNAEWDNIPFSDTILTEYAKAWNKLRLQSVTNHVIPKPEFMDALQRFYYVALAIKGNEVHNYWSHKELHFKEFSIV